MYVAAKGGEAAIDASRQLLAEQGRGPRSLPQVGIEQVRHQLGGAVSRVMAEGSLHDPELAALALVQAQGDAVEAAFLLRAYRTTLPRLATTEPVDTRRMRVRRRISAIFKDLPGGQLLGASFDYTQRLLDFARLRGVDPDAALAPHTPGTAAPQDLFDTAAATDTCMPSALDALMDEGLVEAVWPAAGDPLPPDVTREAPRYPMPRSGRLQMLARADEGWLLGMAYATQRGYAHSHPFAADLRIGTVPVSLVPDELDVAIEIGEIELTECQMVNQFVGSAGQAPRFTRGQGLVFGHNERKSMAIALVDRALRHDEFGEDASSPTQQQEFVLAHGDGVEASGFVQHLKLPHHVTFESELQLLRALRAAWLQARHGGGAPPGDGPRDAAHTPPDNGQTSTASA